MFDFFNIISKEYEMSYEKLKDDKEYKDAVEKLKNEVDAEYMTKDVEVPVTLTKERSRKLFE
jgi:hypothetical protein